MLGGSDFGWVEVDDFYFGWIDLLVFEGVE